jgi:hypothetical protein
LPEYGIDRELNVQSVHHAIDIDVISRRIDPQRLIEDRLDVGDGEGLIRPPLS